MANYRITWRHEVNIEANSQEEAERKWESINLGNLNEGVESGLASSHEWVEDVSFEDENYNEVKFVE